MCHIFASWLAELYGAGKGGEHGQLGSTSNVPTCVIDSKYCEIAVRICRNSSNVYVLYIKGHNFRLSVKRKVGRTQYTKNMNDVESGRYLVKFVYRPHPCEHASIPCMLTRMWFSVQLIHTPSMLARFDLFSSFWALLSLHSNIL